MTVPKMPARMGPIKGEISMLATKVTEEDSTKPRKAITPARVSNIRKSKVKWALFSMLLITSPTIIRDLMLL